MSFNLGVAWGDFLAFLLLYIEVDGPTSFSGVLAQNLLTYFPRARMILAVLLPLSQYATFPTCLYSFRIPNTTLLKEECVLVLILHLITNPLWTSGYLQYSLEPSLLFTDAPQSNINFVTLDIPRGMWPILSTGYCQKNKE